MGPGSGLAAQGAAQHGQHLRRADVLQQIPLRTALQRLEELFVVIADGQHHDGHVRQGLFDLPGGLQPIHAWHLYIHQDEIGPELAGLDHRLEPVIRLTDHLHIGLRADDARQPLAEQGMIIHQQYTRAGGPDEALLRELEAEGTVLRTRIAGHEAWCNRRLLARIHRYTLDRLRKEIEPVTASQFLRFLACWQHADPEHRLDGPRGVGQVVAQLAGFEIPAAAWEGSVLPARVRGYKREWLDQLTLSGEVVWGRLWGAAPGPTRRTPICLLERRDLDEWSALAAQVPAREPSGRALEVQEALLARGAMFFQELARTTKLPPTFVEEGLSELLALAIETSDPGFAEEEVQRASTLRPALLLAALAVGLGFVAGSPAAGAVGCLPRHSRSASRPPAACGSRGF